MSLFKRRPTPVPLGPPKGEILLPDPQTTKRYFEDIEALSEDVIRQARENSDSLRSTTARIVQTVVPTLVAEQGNEGAFADDSEGLTSYSYGVALGLCFASQEFQRGWTKEGQVDGRVHAAMALARPPGGYGSAYFLQVGYWVGRTGEEGIHMLPGDWTGTAQE